MHKTTIWGPGAAGGLARLPASSPASSVLHVPWTPTSGIVVLGCPLHPPGSPSFLEHELAATVAKLEKVCGNLRRVPDPQVQLALLRSSVNACRLNYLLRTCNTTGLVTCARTRRTRMGAKKGHLIVTPNSCLPEPL